MSVTTTSETTEMEQLESELTSAAPEIDDSDFQSGSCTALSCNVSN
jgi:hypothetical protein